MCVCVCVCVCEGDSVKGDTGLMILSSIHPGCHVNTETTLQCKAQARVVLVATVVMLATGACVVYVKSACVCVCVCACACACVCV